MKNFKITFYIEALDRTFTISWENVIINSTKILNNVKNIIRKVGDFCINNFNIYVENILKWWIKKAPGILWFALDSNWYALHAWGFFYFLYPNLVCTFEHIEFTRRVVSYHTHLFLVGMLFFFGTVGFIDSLASSIYGNPEVIEMGFDVIIKDKISQKELTEPIKVVLSADALEALVTEVEYNQVLIQQAITENLGVVLNLRNTDGYYPEEHDLVVKVHSVFDTKPWHKDSLSAGLVYGICFTAFTVLTIFCAK